MTIVMQLMMILRVVLLVMLITSLPITKAETQRKIVQIPGDLVLGGLFPMHEQVILFIFISLYYVQPTSSW